MAADLAALANEDRFPPTMSAIKYVPVTPQDADLPGGVCRGLLAGVGGTADLQEPDGTNRDAVPLKEGYNPLFVKRVRALGTASNIWALY